MMVAGDARLRSPSATAPGREICAFVFGVGAGLTIDEFALWVYLDDVYWAEEGRSSIDATVIAAAAMGLVLLGVSPFDLRHRLGEGGHRQHRRRPAARLRLGRDLLRQGAAAARARRLLLLPDRALRRLPDRQAATRPGRGAATASGGRRSRRRPKSASTPTAAPSASRTPSATSSAASRARASQRPRDEAIAATREAGEEVRERAEQLPPASRKTPSHSATTA